MNCMIKSLAAVMVYLAVVSDASNIEVDNLSAPCKVCGLYIFIIYYTLFAYADIPNHNWYYRHNLLLLVS